MPFTETLKQADKSMVPESRCGYLWEGVMIEGTKQASGCQRYLIP